MPPEPEPAVSHKAPVERIDPTAPEDALDVQDLTELIGMTIDAMQSTDGSSDRAIALNVLCAKLFGMRRRLQGLS